MDFTETVEEIGLDEGDRLELRRLEPAGAVWVLASPEAASPRMLSVAQAAALAGEAEEDVLRATELELEYWDESGARAGLLGRRTRTRTRGSRLSTKVGETFGGVYRRDRIRSLGLASSPTRCRSSFGWRASSGSTPSGGRSSATQPITPRRSRPCLPTSTTSSSTRSESSPHRRRTSRLWTARRCRRSLARIKGFSTLTVQDHLGLQDKLEWKGTKEAPDRLRSRSADRIVTQGDEDWARIGAWPWATFGESRLPLDWRRRPETAEALVAWINSA